MKAANPGFILRNWVAQNAIAKAEEGDFEEVRIQTGKVVSAGNSRQGEGAANPNPLTCVNPNISRKPIFLPHFDPSKTPK